IPHTIEVDSKRYTFFEVMKRIDEKCYIDIQMPQEVLERKISDINRCKVDYVTTADSYEKEYEIFRIAKAVVEKAEGLGFGIDIHESKENCMAQACIPSPLLYTSEEDLTELLIKRERIEISENTGKTQKSELTLSPEKIEGICYRKSGKIYVDAVFGYIGSTPLFDGNEAAQWKKDYMRTSTKYIKTLSTGIEEFIDDALGFIFNPINSYIIEPSINKIKHPFKKYFEKKEIKEVARIREKEKRMTKVYQTMVDTGFKKAKKDKDEVTDPTARCFILVGKECKGHE
ncbi:MAG: hypothetical protein U9P44_04120, partial [archaeon]|nr:hypothetical protein [archaeon]